VAGLSLLFNVFQFVYHHRRRVKVTIKALPHDDPTMKHVRVLLVEVENRGVELHKVKAVLEFPDDDGKLIQFPMTPVPDVPEPFKFGYSASFGTLNEEPRQPLKPLMKSHEQIAMKINSGVITVKKIKAKKWLKQLEYFRQPEPSLPDKPKPKPSTQTSDWLHGYKKW
jgi:hypothetical protein